MSANLTYHLEAWEVDPYDNSEVKKLIAIVRAMGGPAKFLSGAPPSLALFRRWLTEQCDTYAMRYGGTPVAFFIVDREHTALHAVGNLHEWAMWHWREADSGELAAIRRGVWEVFLQSIALTYPVLRCYIEDEKRGRAMVRLARRYGIEMALNADGVWYGEVQADK